MARNSLFEPLVIRGLTLKNRTVVSPMCQYSATKGMLNDWHVGHLGQFASGGAGLVFLEATAVEARGRITYGDSGLWSDDHMVPMRAVIEAVKSRGAAVGVQLAHAGRKASISRPWEGDGPLSPREIAKGETPWPIVAPSAVAFGDGWLVPHELSVGEIAGVVESWGAAARRAVAVGFDAIEIHSAHGYLSHTFLSPMSNRRKDAYGGSLDNRMRFTLEVIEAVRATIPEAMPLFLRISCIDGKRDGWAIDDSIALAKCAKALGVDVIDCSSGGIAGYGENLLKPPTPGYQVAHAATIRHEAGILTQAVGLIVDPAQAETILRAGAADLVALARELLHNPYWVRHAAIALNEPNNFADWPIQYGHWLALRAKGMFGARAGDADTELMKLQLAQRQN